MIVELLAQAVAGILSWLVGLFEGVEIPEWWFDFSDLFAQVIAAGVGMGAWIPWDVLAGVLSAVLGLWLVLWLVKGVRWVVGWVPTMGGS